MNKLHSYLIIFHMLSFGLCGGDNSNQVYFKVRGGHDDMYYAAEFYVGAGGQPQTAIIDTGSDMLAFPCDLCRGVDCGTHQDPRFLSLKSSTFDANVNCPESLLDKELRACTFIKKYMEGSSISGIRASDFFRFKSRLRNEGSSVSQFATSGKKELLFRAEFGCTTKETGLFVSQQADGILGLDDNSSFIRSVETENHSNPQILSFGMCFDWNGGFMSFELNPKGALLGTADSDNYLVVDYDSANSDFNVVVESISIAGERLFTQSTRATFDTGTTFTMFPKWIGTLIFDALNNYCQKNNEKCGRLKQTKLENDWCAELILPDEHFSSIDQVIATFPTISLNLEGGNRPYEMRPENYFYKTDKGKTNKICLSISSDDSLARIIIGGFGMINHFVYFDRLHKKMAIDNNVDCSQVPKPLIRKAVSEGIAKENIWEKVRLFLSDFMSKKN